MSQRQQPRKLTSLTLSLGLLGAALCLALLLALATGAHAMPLNDDWWRAVSAQQQGPLSYAAMRYQTWFGRWFACVVQITMLKGFDVYGVYAWLLLGLGAAQLLALRMLFGRLLLGSGRAWIAALGGVVLLWCATPHASEYWYWFSGASEYSLSVSAGIVVVSLASLGGTMATGAACASALLVGGLHELSGITTLVALAAGAWAAPASARQRWLCIGGFALVGLVINLAAPGNAVRAEHEHVDRSLGPVLWAVRWNLYHEVLRWLLDVKLWLATALLGSAIALVEQPFWRPAPERLRYAAPAATGVAGVAWVLAAPIMAGFRFNDRSASACHATLFVGWLVTLWAWAPWLRSYFGPRLRQGHLVLCGVLLSLALLSTGNARLAGWSLRSELPAWSSAQLARHHLALREARAGASSVTLPGRVTPPVLYMQDDVGEDATDWRNEGFAELHGLKAVRVVASP